MSRASDELKKYYIKMVHTLKREYFPDEECRYAYMRGRFNKSSLKELALNELRAMLIDMGYKPRKQGVLKKEMAHDGKATQKQLDTITGIWEQVARTKTNYALRVFIERITGKFVMHLWYLTKEEASNVIKGLKNMQREANKPIKSRKNRIAKINNDIIPANNADFGRA